MLSGFLLKLVTFRSRTHKRRIKELLIIGKERNLVNWKREEVAVVYLIFFNLSKVTGVLERGRREQCLKFPL